MSRLWLVAQGTGMSPELETLYIEPNSINAFSELAVYYCGLCVLIW